MAFLKKYYNVAANSILESVIALTIISICLYFAVLIFSVVFTPRTTTKFYATQNKINEIFFLAQLNADSIISENQNPNWNLEEEIISVNLKKITVQYKDSSKVTIKKQFYVPLND